MTTTLDRTIYNERSRTAQTRIAGYNLTMYERASAWRVSYDLVLKKGSSLVGIWHDFRPGMLHAIDSPAAWAAAWSFVTLRPGDTDPEYFDDYTSDMLAFMDGDAEMVGYAAYERFEGDR